uniref:Uncharacterized protein n=1 Tax=Magnetococcus massalia (strain MO-1) TaxID=451514 RepID=A0A1S7LGD5_MAGMO|nr:conserved protein of unknown function [Candidatus Magnetococcus massalia]
MQMIARLLKLDKWPKLVKFLLAHMLIGFMIGWSAVYAILLFDVHGMATLIERSPDGGMILFILTFFMSLTCASAQMGMATILLGHPDDPSGGRLVRTWHALMDWLFPPHQARVPVKSEYRKDYGRRRR